MGGPVCRLEDQMRGRRRRQTDVYADVSMQGSHTAARQVSRSL